MDYYDMDNNFGQYKYMKWTNTQLPVFDFDLGGHPGGRQEDT